MSSDESVDGRKFLFWRKKKGFARDPLGTKIGLTGQRLYQIEKVDKEPAMYSESFKSLAKEYGMSLDELRDAIGKSDTTILIVRTDAADAFTQFTNEYFGDAPKDESLALSKLVEHGRIPAKAERNAIIAPKAVDEAARSSRARPEPTTIETIQAEIAQFLESHPSDALSKGAAAFLGELDHSKQVLAGGAKAWAAGLLYAAATYGKRPCGLPGILNSDFSKYFGVTMATIRRRAAAIARTIND